MMDENSERLLRSEETSAANERKRRSLLPHRIYSRVYGLETVSDRSMKNSEKLWEFYKKSGFLYDTKLAFLSPIREDILDTYDKLLSCQDDTCHFIFVTDENELIGSVMATRYTDQTWMVQHITTLREYRATSIPKELVLSMNSWMIKKKSMRYFINYFKPTTRWAYKTYFAILNQLENTKYASMDTLEYMVLDLNKKLPLFPQKGILEIVPMQSIDIEKVYNMLLRDNPEIVLNALGLSPSTFSCEMVSHKYSDLGLYRDRKYLVAKNRKGQLAGIAVADVSSSGISLSLLFDAFYIFVFDSNMKEEVIAALANEINRTLKEHNKSYSIALVNEEDKPIYENLGYQYSRT